VEQFPYNGVSTLQEYFKEKAKKANIVDFFE
jgi:hypothetical protein